MSDMLFPCPFNPAVMCKMDEPCRGCEEYVPSNVARGLYEALEDVQELTYESDANTSWEATALMEEIRKVIGKALKRAKENES